MQNRLILIYWTNNFKCFEKVKKKEKEKCISTVQMIIVRILGFVDSKQMEWK